MVILVRSLDVIAALMLEVTVVYVDTEFPDVVSPDARFAAFVLVTMHLLWRCSILWTNAVPLIIAASAKLRRNLGLTPIVESVFSQFCYKKDE